jgi:hypothetical protein
MIRLCKVLFYVFTSFAISISPLTTYADSALPPKEEELNIFPTAPSGYELQKFELGGWAFRPKDWQYYEQDDRAGLTWIISEEAPDHYETGLKIQVLVGMNENIGKTPEQLARSQIKMIKDSALELHECISSSPITIGYSRECVQVVESLNLVGIEKKYEVITSFLWNNNDDILVVTTFGTPVGKWSKVRNHADVMTRFAIPDAKFIKKALKIAVENNP